MVDAFDLPDLEDKRPELIRPFAVIPSRAVTDRKLEPVDIRVLACMARYSDHNGITRIGVESISKLTGTLPKRVSAALSRLKRRGYFKLISPYRMGTCNGKRQIIYDVPGTEHVPIPRHLMPDYDQPVPL